MALFGRRGPRRGSAPAAARALLASGERVVSWAPSAAGPVVATPLGLWWPFPDGPRRIAWHLISHAVWDEGTLAVTEAEIVDDLLLVDRAAVSVRPDPAFDLPATVQRRVTNSVARSELMPVAGGVARFVARRVPGQDGVQWWARLERGTPDTPAVRDAVRERIALLSGLA